MPGYSRTYRLPRACGHGQHHRLNHDQHRVAHAHAGQEHSPIQPDSRVRRLPADRRGGDQHDQEPPQPGTQADLVANVGDRIFFDFDKSDVRSDQRQRLDAWADWLKKYPQVTAVIEGHCDERGTREYNLALGERRASSAKNYLVAKGVDAKRLQTISYGKERPAVLGSNEASWSQNRRAVLVVQ